MTTRLRAGDGDCERMQAKRTRLDPTSSSTSSSSLDPTDQTPLPVADDGYVEGSIVKVMLRNFVTYDYCEFCPGPQLNMIIGPNGTGKSTIVCAVALGLGGSPALLGRSKNIAEFVKTGEDEALIQIELKCLQGPNAVIQRRIKKSTNATTWKLNGRTASQRDVLNVITSLNIQVDNLCQFLPQDKVAEFAQLTPSQLLDRTQTAAGEKELETWLATLIEKQKEHNDLQKSHTSDLDHLKSLQARNQDLERDVQKMQQREQILKRIDLLQAKMPLVKYSEAKRDYDDAKAEEQELREKVEQLKRQVEPLTSTVRLWEDMAKTAATKRDELKRQVTQSTATVKKCADDIELSKAQTQTFRTELEHLERREADSAKEIATLEDRVHKLQDYIAAGPPPEADTSNLTHEIDAINNQLHHLTTQLDELRYEFRSRQEEERAVQNDLDRRKQELDELRNVQRQRVLNLQRHHPDSFKAFQWLQQHRNEFRGRIYGPIQVVLNLKDKRYADMVESILGGEGGSHMRTFVCEYKEDYQKFTRLAVDEMKWNLTVGWPGNVDEESIKPPMTDEELKNRFGMDSFVVNLLEAPKIVLTYLCINTHIHQIPVSLNLVNETLMAEKSDFRRYIMKDNVYEVRRYSYGRGGRQTTVRKTNEARVLNDAMDTDARQRITQDIQQLQQQMEEFKTQMSDISARRQQWQQQTDELKHKKEDLHAKKRDMQQERMKYNRHAMQLESCRDELERKREQTPSFARDRAMTLENIISEANKRVSLMQHYKDAVATLVDRYLNRNLASLEALQSTAKFEAVRLFSRSQLTDLKSAKDALEQATAECRRKKTLARSLYETAQQAGAELKEELADEFLEIFDRWRREGLDQSVIELEDSINAEKAKADALKFANPQAMRQYEIRQAEIRSRTEKMENDKQKLHHLTEEITLVRSQWEPRIEALVAKINTKFSDALQRIGCAGEVDVNKEGEFEKWGIEIRVKFRDHEKLHLLTGQRQSGGERAVSTILYLMSLQDLAKSPFRVVDEINQGMDPRNERMIHEHIVREATRAGTAQYFLITPKLLPHLYYNERMQVLCIYNGEWQPETMKPLSMFISQAEHASVR